MKLILGSNSPRRKEILKNIGYQFEVVTKEIDESTEEAVPEIMVQQLADRKASTIYGLLKDKEAVVIGADTIVVLDGEVLGKPENSEEAYQMLLRLCGREHKVLTSVALYGPENKKFVYYEETKVSMKDYSNELIDSYVKTEEPLDKAGAYGIQGKGSLLVKKINGEYFNVVGLPIAKLSDLLSKEFGIKPF